MTFYKLIFTLIIVGFRSFRVSKLRYRTTMFAHEFSANADLDVDRELIKVFGRISDDYLLLNVSGAGSPEMINCCHGGCDNCAYSRIFDNMSAGKPKWIPVYASRRLIDGRNHMSKWSEIFFCTHNSAARNHLQSYVDLHLEAYNYEIGKSEFSNRLIRLPYTPCLGPPTSCSQDEPISDTILEKLWVSIQQLSRAAPHKNTVNPNDMALALKSLSKEDHGFTWSVFSNQLKTEWGY